MTDIDSEAYDLAALEQAADAGADIVDIGHHQRRPDPPASADEPDAAAAGWADIARPVDWNELYNGTDDHHEWLAEPIIPVGRAVALYGPAKVGKSELTLHLAVGIAHGRDPLTSTKQAERRVLYVDYEMTPGDLLDRLEGAGIYDPPNWMTMNLVYLQLPPIPPLDTPAGGEALAELVDHHTAEVVVIDTFSRAVQGEENSADTVRAFYSCTGILLKQRGVTVVRADHSGKDQRKGPRGSSAKGDDVDLTWKMRRGDGNRVDLTSTSRVGWIPPTVTLERRVDDNDIVSYRQAPTDSHDAAMDDLMVAGKVAELDQLDVPVTASRREAMNALRDAGLQPGRATVLGAALKRRKQAAAEAAL